MPAAMKGAISFGLLHVPISLHTATQKLMYKGHVTLGVSGEAFAKIKAQQPISTPPFWETVPAGHGNEKAMWLKPTLVCTVKFMHRTKNGGMRQPVFKGLRKDKGPLECVEQIGDQ